MLGRRTMVAIVTGLAAATVVGVVSAKPPAPAGPPPPTLMNELLVGTTTTIVGSCNPSGISTIEFSSSGAATGPYTGTFEETGTLTLGPLPAPGFPFATSPLLTFDASFEIDSPTGFVTGTKTYVVVPGITTGFGACTSFAAVPGLGTGTVEQAFVFVDYDATIETPGGATYRDEGRTDVDLSEIQTELVSSRTFDEEFISLLTEPVLCDKFKDKPGTAKDKCKTKKVK